jgi:hypothetical protein
MTNDVLDAEAHFNPEALDSKTRIKISDAIIEVNDHLKKVKFGQYLLLALAGLSLLVPLLTLFMADQVPPNLMYSTLIGIAIIAVPFLAFGILYPKNPLLFLLLGLIAYIVFQILTVVLLGKGIADGYAWKIAILTGFIYSLYSESKWKENLNKLHELGYPSSVIREAQKKLTPIPRLRRKRK